MPKKGISVKLDEDFYAEISEYLRNNGLTLTELVTTALDNELHPKITEKEGSNMANTRTVAFQVPEEMFQRIKDYLHRNNMSQKDFVIGLIETELDREQTEREGFAEAPDQEDGVEGSIETDEDETEGFTDEDGDTEDEDEEFAEDEEESEGMTMGGM